MLAGSIWRKSRLWNRRRWSGDDILPKFVENGESLLFFAATGTLLISYE